jgi:Zn-dependent protease
VTAEIEQLATQARQLTALGQLAPARDRWLAILNLLPTDSRERQGVIREIQRIDARLAPKPRVDWKKRLGPLGIGIAFLAKFKTVALLALTKGKFFFSILAFVGFYWALFGWWFAVGLAGSVLMHEMGHYFMVRFYGFKAELPMFLPGLGAYVKWRGAAVDVGIRAQISLAGPLFGLLSGFIAYGVFAYTHSGVWLAVAQFAGWLNLINLIPVSIFDGGSALNALGAQHRLALLGVCIVMAFLLHEWAFLFVGLGTAYRLWQRDFPAESNQGVAYSFIALAVANGFLSWYCTNEARLLFGRG